MLVNYRLTFAFFLIYFHQLPNPPAPLYASNGAGMLKLKTGVLMRTTAILLCRGFKSIPLQRKPTGPVSTNIRQSFTSHRSW